jgi:hypothetical protein
MTGQSAGVSESAGLQCACKCPVYSPQSRRTSSNSRTSWGRASLPGTFCRSLSAPHSRRNRVLPASVRMLRIALRARCWRAEICSSTNIGRPPMKKLNRQDIRKCLFLENGLDRGPASQPERANRRKISQCRKPACGVEPMFGSFGVCCPTEIRTGRFGERHDLSTRVQPVPLPAGIDDPAPVEFGPE